MTYTEFCKRVSNWVGYDISTLECVDERTFNQYSNNPLGLMRLCYDIGFCAGYDHAWEDEDD